jgi:hypothetical protein
VNKSSYSIRLWSSSTTTSNNILLHLFPGSLVYMWWHAHNGVINSMKTWQKTARILQIASRSLGIWFILNVVATLSAHN